MFRFALSLLLVGPASGSLNRLYYACDTAHLASWCEFVITPEAPAEWGGQLVEHAVDVTVGDPGHRKVVDMDGEALPVTPKPWTNGDVLVASDAAVTGDSLNYATVFELVAPLRDRLMYHSDELAADPALWSKYTKAFTDCGVKLVDEAGDHATAYGTDGVYEWIKDTQNKDIHNYMLQYLEEGAIDLVCLVTDLSMSRCDTIRAAAGIAVGTHCNCWFQAWRDLYGSDPGLFPVDAGDFADCSAAPPPTTPPTPPPTPPGDGTQTCAVPSDCVGYKGCTANNAACKCKKGQCRRKRVDCKTHETAKWGCPAGTSCFREFRGPSWSTCASPVEEHLGLRFLTAAEVAAAFDKTEGAVVAHHGLVQYEAGGGGARIETHESRLLPFASYDEFQRMCVTKCQRNAKCAAATVQVQVWSSDWEALGQGPNYLCFLTADVEVRGVRAAQLSASTVASDTVYVKKGRVVPPVEPCKVQVADFARSLACAGCLQVATPALCDSMYGPDCYGLLYETPGNADFLEKMAPGAGCLTAMGANVTACLTCTTEKLLALPSITTIAGTICSEDDDVNLVRGLCKEECYTGSEGCEGALQTVALCASGSPLVRDDTGWIYGGINTPYVCPETV